MYYNLSENYCGDVRVYASSSLEWLRNRIARQMIKDYVTVIKMYWSKRDDVRAHIAFNAIDGTIKTPWGYTYRVSVAFGTKPEWCE